MRIPGPGEFIPDAPVAASGGILIFLVIVAVVLDAFASSGAGEPGSLNYVSRQSVCAPSIEKVNEVQARAREAYDTGAPETTETLRRVVEGTGSFLLPVGTEVKVLRKGNAGYAVVSALRQPAGECLVATNQLKMGWGEWISWNWREFRKSQAAKRELANSVERIQRRFSEVETKIVACRTGPLIINYNGVDIEQATPVDFSRCLRRGGVVSVKGPPGGRAYYRDGRMNTHVDLSVASMLFAGPAGTSARAECSCADSPVVAGHRAEIPAPTSQDIVMMAPVGRWSDRVKLDNRPVTCEQFAQDVLIQGDDESRTIVDGPTSRDWSGIVGNDNLKTIRFQAKGNQEMRVVCHIEKVTPTRD
jgi:hypothetical protein